MTTSTAASFIAVARSAGSCPSAVGALRPVDLAKPYATDGQKRFAMAGTHINVWPLGPQEWTSG